MSVIYVNAEGKANSVHQVKVIIETAFQKHGSSWLFIFISEADYRWSSDKEEDRIGRHLVQRFPILDGRAAKLIWNVKCKGHVVQMYGLIGLAVWTLT